jgi:hypothetical protein
MGRAVLPFPVLPGKTEDDIWSIANRFKSDKEAYIESRRRLGVTLERVYWQHTPMGDFVVAYLETRGSVAESFGAPAQSDLDIDKFFVAKIKEVHGIDLSQPPAGPPPETVGEWFDPKVTARGRGMAFCAPLVSGKEDEGRAFAREAYVNRVDEFAASRRAIGQNAEVVTLIETPQGPVIAVYVEGSDPFDGNRKFAASTSPFDVWFKQECAKIFAPFVDFNNPVEGVTEIFDSAPVLQTA